MNQNVINIESKFACFKDYWSPRVIAELNDYQFKLVKAKGKFVWHTHQETDEAFIIIDGALKIEFRDRSINLNPGEMFIVRKGVEHRPIAQDECKIMILEPKNVINTGDSGGELTASNDIWV